MSGQLSNIAEAGKTTARRQKVGPCDVMKLMYASYRGSPLVLKRELNAQSEDLRSFT